MKLENTKEVYCKISRIYDIDTNLKALKTIGKYSSNFSLLIKNMVTQDSEGNAYLKLNERILNFIIESLETEKSELEKDLELL